MRWDGRGGGRTGRHRTTRGGGGRTSGGDDVGGGCRGCLEVGGDGERAVDAAGPETSTYPDKSTDVATPPPEGLRLIH